MADSSVLIARYRVVTPMFLSGADQSKAELRLPSFKGVLRFWWRALADERDLGKLHQQEDTLFGSTARVSKVRMSLRTSEHLPVVAKGTVLTDGGQRVVGEGARYLGYGVMEAFDSKKKETKAGQLTRPCLQSPFVFSVELRTSGVGAPQMQSLRQALIALGTMGGLGSKSRKGYGSVMLEELEQDNETVWSAPESVDALITTIKSLYPQANKRQSMLPPYTAMSGLSRHIVATADAQTTLGLLDRIGREMVRYRSWGRNGRVLGTESERNFRADHDLMKMAVSERRTHPRRIAFGLPHNYGKARSQQIPPAAGGDDAINRRASPLFLHMHEIDGRAIAVLSFLPGQFLPGGAQAGINVGGVKVPVTPHPQIWEPVQAFLDRLVTGNGRKESFSRVLEVQP